MTPQDLDAALTDTVQLTVVSSGDPGDPAWAAQSDGDDGKGAATVIGVPAGEDQLHLVGQLLVRRWREAKKGVDEFGQAWTTFFQV